MKDEVEVVGKMADATTEVAKTGGKAIDAASGAGKFLGEVFGDLVKDGVGLLADRLKYYRLERAALLESKTQEKLKILGIDKLRHVTPKVAIPLIENATIEDDDELHSLWANLLTSALIPTGEEVTKKYVTVLAEMSAFEAQKFQSLIDEIKSSGLKIDSVELSQINDNDTHGDDAIRSLMRLGLIKPVINILNFRRGISGPPITVNNDTRKFKFTAFGASFAKAVLD
jgi:hypothetical protein